MNASRRSRRWPVIIAMQDKKISLRQLHEKWSLLSRNLWRRHSNNLQQEGVSTLSQPFFDFFYRTNRNLSYLHFAANRPRLLLNLPRRLSREYNRKLGNFWSNRIASTSCQDPPYKNLPWGQHELEKLSATFVACHPRGDSWQEASNSRRRK